MDSETKAPGKNFTGKTGAFLTGIGKSAMLTSYGLYEKAEDMSFRLKCMISEKWFLVMGSLKKEKKTRWEDKRKKALLGFMNPARTTSGQSQVENGIMGLIAIKKGAEVLELGCGDGFDARFFYSSKAFHITAIDSDHGAINHAMKYHQARNITYKLCDFSRDMTVGKFDTIIWNQGPEDFPVEITDKIIELSRIRLDHQGIMAGSSNIMKSQGWLNSIADLEKMLKTHFVHVKVKESGFSENVFFFYASDDELRLI